MSASRKAFLVPTLVSFGLGVVLVLGLWLQVAPIGPNRFLAEAAEGLTVVSLGCLAMMATLGLLGMIALLLADHRFAQADRIRAVFLGLLMACVPLVVAKAVQRPIRRAGLERAARNSAPLIAAIERYREDNNKLPLFIELLVPRYLPELPFTGMFASPDYHYARVDGKSGDQSEFRLSVDVRVPWTLFARFVYLSSQEYPTARDSERIGGWCYFRDTD